MVILVAERIAFQTAATNVRGFHVLRRRNQDSSLDWGVGVGLASSSALCAGVWAAGLAALAPGGCGSRLFGPGRQRGGFRGWLHDPAIGAALELATESAFRSTGSRNHRYGCSHLLSCVIRCIHQVTAHSWSFSGWAATWSLDFLSIIRRSSLCLFRHVSE